MKSEIIGSLVHKILNSILDDDYAVAITTAARFIKDGERKYDHTMVDTDTNEIYMVTRLQLIEEENKNYVLVCIIKDGIFTSEKLSMEEWEFISELLYSKGRTELERLNSLRSALSLAYANENYELVAKLDDQIISVDIPTDDYIKRLLNK